MAEGINPKDEVQNSAYSLLFPVHIPVGTLESSEQHDRGILTILFAQPFSSPLFPLSEAFARHPHTQPLHDTVRRRR
jgi:hypothetical protein